MESAEQRDIKLIQSVPGAVQPEGDKPISLTNDLKQIGVNASHIAGNAFDELINGEGRDTRDRVAIPRNPISLIKEKFRKFRLARRKAA